MITHGDHPAYTSFDVFVKTDCAAIDDADYENSITIHRNAFPTFSGDMHAE